MKKLSLFLLVIFSFTAVRSQFVYKIKADSVLITNDSCTAELIIENSTKNVKGFLVNKGNGRTEFRRATQLTDSSFIVAGDTIIIKGVYSYLYSKAGIGWTARTSAADNNWRSVAYGNGLFVAVAFSGTGNRVMTSPDGINWTARTSAADNNWNYVTYGNGLFVAVAFSGTGNRVMTSPDGINWTARTSAADNDWYCVTYGNGLFVATAISGTGNRVMTSPDGIKWTARTSTADNNWRSVAYGNGLFVAVASTGTDRVMTSPDGINWTARTAAVNNTWNGVTYGNGLFVAVAYSGTGNRVMTSPDGINWTARTSAADYDWFTVTYGNGLFVAVSANGVSNGIMTSFDGINWTARQSPVNNSWLGVTYGNGLFVAVAYTGTGNRVMTSGVSDIASVQNNNIYQGGMIINGKVGIGTTTPEQILHVKGQVKIDTLTNGTVGTDSVLVTSNGLIKKVSGAGLTGGGADSASYSTNYRRDTAAANIRASFSSGSYTPTLTNTANITSSSLGQATYMRIGDIVTVTIGGSLTPTTINTASTLTFDLPIATTDNAQAYIGSGSIAYNAGSFGYYGGLVEILSSTTAGRFYFYPTVTTGSTANFSFTFTYKLN